MGHQIYFRNHCLFKCKIKHQQIIDGTPQVNLEDSVTLKQIFYHFIFTRYYQLCAVEQSALLNSMQQIQFVHRSMQGVL